MTTWLEDLQHSLKSCDNKEDGNRIVESKLIKLSKNDTLRKSFSDPITISTIAGHIAAVNKKKIVMANEIDNIFQMDPTEVVEAFKSTDIYNDKLFKALLKEVGDRTNIAQQYLVDELKKKLQDATEQSILKGQSYKDFVDSLFASDVVASLGITRNYDSYLQMAFKTNLNTAYSEGKYAQAQELKDSLPYWQFLAIGANPCHKCIKLNNAVFRVTNDTLMPPLHYNDVCDFILLRNVPDGSTLYEDNDKFMDCIDPNFTW